MRRSSSLLTGPSAILILFIAILILGKLGSALSLVTLGLMLEKVHFGLAAFLIILGLSSVFLHR